MTEKKWYGSDGPDLHGWDRRGTEGIVVAVMERKGTDGKGKDRGGMAGEGGVNMIKNDILLVAYREIEMKHGFVTPSAVVEYAQPDTSPLHNAFEWDDSKAAVEYRMWQARQLIVRAKVEDHGREIQAYHSVLNRAVVDEPAYYSWDKVKTAPTLMSEVVKNALDELEYWQDKYETYVELAGLVNKEKVAEIRGRYVTA